MQDNFFNYLKERGFVYQVTDEEKVAAILNSDKKITFYLGIDPTADSMHIGHFFALRMFSLLQRQGHRGILLFGGATGQIGDPTGKQDLRKMMTKEQVQQNVNALMNMSKKFIKTDGENPAVVVDNSEWVKNYSYIDFMRDIGIHFNVNKMLASEAYSSRLEQGGLTFLEMGYMLLQAYDFVCLNHQYGCSLEIGGSDQWGNIVAGTELSRKMNLAEGKTTAERPEAFGLTSPLLMTSEGKKMGKTEKGALWVAQDKTSPYDFYQYFYNTDDKDCAMLLKVFTDIPTAEIDAMCQTDIVAAKKTMAYEVTKLVHGQAEADKALEATRSLFGNGSNMDDVPTKLFDFAKVKSGINVVDLLAESGFLASKGEAKRMIAQGGISIDGKKIASAEEMIATDKNFMLLQKGKKVFLKLTD